MGNAECAVKNKPCATAFALSACQQTIRVRDNIPLLSWLMLKGAAATVRRKSASVIRWWSYYGTRFFAGESGVARKWMGAGVMILSAWLIAASIIDLDNQCCPMFLLRAYCGPG